MKAKKMSKFTVLLLCLLMAVAFMPTMSFAGEATAEEGYTLSTDKDTYAVGEAINVTATSADAGAWIGIFDADGDINQPSYWWIDGTVENKNVLEGTRGSGRPSNQTFLQPGTYKIVTITGSPYEVKAQKEITVVPDEGYDISTDKSEYTLGEAVNVTATGTDSNTWIGLYRADASIEDIAYEKTASLRWAYKGTVNVFGDVDSSTLWAGSGSDWTPSAGTYKLVVFKDFSTPYVAEKVITIKVTSEANPDDYALSVESKNIAGCQALNVTATGPDSSAWVGLYKDGETPGEADSYFWYYVNGSYKVDSKTGYFLNIEDEITLTWESGTAYDILSQAVANNREKIDWTSTLPEGDYKVVLFADGGYDSIMQTVEGIHITDHKYVLDSVSLEPTCEGEGMGTYKCEYCGDTKTDTIAALSHEYGEETVLKKATDKEDGSIGKVCKNCGDEQKTAIIPMIGKVSLSKTTYTYNGKTRKPSVTVLDVDGDAIDAENYDVTIGSNKKVGKYNVTVTFKNKYEGTKTLTYTITPSKVSIKTPAGAKKAMTIKWKKNTTGSGYQVRYATKKSFKGAKVKTVTKNKTTSLKVKKQKKGKKYVQVRSYKKVKFNEKTITLYGPWSSVKTVKVK